MEPELEAEPEPPAARSLWITRMQLPSELAAAADSGVAGGRRNNPRGKRVWPICPGPRHRSALRATLQRAAEAVSGSVDRLRLYERYGIATFDSEATARAVCGALEATEVQWTTAQRSADSGGPGTTTLDAAGACLVDFEPQFLDADVAIKLQEGLLDGTPWVGAKPDLPPERQPRQVCYMADDDSMAYTYGGKRWAPLPWSQPMLDLRTAVETACGGGGDGQSPSPLCRFNSCLLNLYRDGSDHVPWHADDEPVYGDLGDCTIASVSLGAARLFQIRTASLDPRHPPLTGPAAAEGEAGATGQRWKYMLTGGSLLVMRGATQLHYQHRIPKRQRRPVGLRINATFRCVKRPERLSEPGPGPGPEPRGEVAADQQEQEEGHDEHAEDNDEEDEDEDSEDRESRQFVRFAARPFSDRIFVGHGVTKLCPRGAAALQQSVAAALAEESQVRMETAHRGYAFANLSDGRSQQSAEGGGGGGGALALSAIHALDGTVLHVEAEATAAAELTGASGDGSGGVKARGGYEMVLNVYARQAIPTAT